MQAFNWLNYLNEYEGAHIQHQRNRGKEVRFGRYPVDGYDPQTNIVYEFQVSLRANPSLYARSSCPYIALCPHDIWSFLILCRGAITTATTARSPKMSRMSAGTNEKSP